MIINCNTLFSLLTSVDYISKRKLTKQNIFINLSYFNIYTTSQKFGIIKMFYIFLLKLHCVIFTPI